MSQAPVRSAVRAVSGIRASTGWPSSATRRLPRSTRPWACRFASA